MTDTYIQRIQGLSTMIGNTPMLSIDFKFKGENRKLYAKAQKLNMTGSIKDRMAFHILRSAMERKELKAGDEIIEATSGNTGIAISAIGRALGHPVTIFMPDWLSKERINLIKSLGATINLVSKEEGGFLGSIEMANQLAKSLGAAFLPHQFDNMDNVDAHYLTTGPEIWWQLEYRGMKPDAFVAGVGTGGTVMGVGKFLKEKHPGIKIHPLEPSNSPTLSTGWKIGKHRIQGISDEFIPSICKLNELDSIVAVDDGDAIIMAQKLAEVGIGVGISSGANFIGALMLQNEMGAESVVATIFSDCNKKYLSTDLMNKEPVKEGFLSSNVEIISVQSFKRVCYLCCDPNDCAESNYTNTTESVHLPCCQGRKELFN